MTASFAASRRRRVVLPLAVLAAVALVAAACGGSDDSPAAPATTAAPADTSLQQAGMMNLAGFCPNPLVLQTDWFPESEHGAVYELLGPGYIVDAENKVVRGPMMLGGVPMGIHWEVRTGGPAIGFAPVSSWMATDDSIHLGYASTDQQVAHFETSPLVSVVAPLEKNPQMIMWDPETYPDIETLADLGEAGVTVNVFGGGTFPSVFIAQGIWSADQVDESYNGAPARFISEGGAIAQQGFASSEVYTYEHDYEEWGKPVAFQLLHDAGYVVYSQTIAVRPTDMGSMRPCLERLVPIIQQAVLDYYQSPERANAIIVDAVEQFQDFWQYSPELAAFSARVQRQYGLAGNGYDTTIGDLEGHRIQRVIDSMKAAGMEVNPGLNARHLFTNEFIDWDIGMGQVP